MHRCAASSLSSLAASEAAAAVGAAIDIDTYFRGSNGFFAPMQNSYPHGKKPKSFIPKLRHQMAICWLGKELPWPIYLETCAFAHEF